MKTPFWKGASKSRTTQTVWAGTATTCTLAPVIVALLVHFIPGDFWSLDLGPIAGLDGLTLRQAAITLLAALSTGLLTRALAFFQRPGKRRKAENNIRFRQRTRHLPR